MPSASSCTAARPGRWAGRCVRANTLVRAAGQHAERGVGAGQAGGDLVQRAVAAEADDHVDAAAGRVLGEAGGVAAAVGLDDLDVVAAGSALRCTTTVLRAVTDEANELTTSRMRKAATLPGHAASVASGVGLGPVADWLGNNGAAMNVVVCVKQIPDPADARARSIRRPTRSKREGKLILDESDSYGVEMALQLVDKAGGGEVTLVSMAPNGEVVRPAHRARHGRGQGHPRVSDPALAGSDALTTAKVLAEAHRARRRRRPGARRHRVDRRLHRHRARADRRAARPARRSRSPSTSRSPAARSRSQRQTEAGYDEVECPLPAVVSVTAGVVEPRYPSFKGIMAAKTKPVDRSPSPTSASTPPGRLGRRRPGDRRRRRRPPAREAGENIEDDGEALREDRRVPRASSRSSEDTRSWRSPRSGCSPRPPTARSPPPRSSCSPRPASSADTVEAVYVGGDADAVAAALGAYGATKVLRHRRPRRRAARRRRSPRRIAAVDRRRRRARRDPVRADLRRPRHRRPACR